MKRTIVAYATLSLLMGPALAQQNDNRTPYKTQTEEYFSTHKPGRIFDPQSGLYKSGQENRVYVDEYQRQDGTVIEGHTRAMPGQATERTSSKRSGGSKAGFKNGGKSKSGLDFNRGYNQLGKPRVP